MENRIVKESPGFGGGGSLSENEKTDNVQFADFGAASSVIEKLKKKHHGVKKLKRPKLTPFEKRYSTLSEEHILVPEKKHIDYVLIYPVEDQDGPNEDDRKNKKRKTMYREIFEHKLKVEGFVIQFYISHDYVFVKLHCPFKRLCKEAEKVKLEMPLKDCKNEENEPKNFLQHFIKDHFETDSEISDFVSGPFQMNKIHIYEGHENPGEFFRPSLRSLLVHHILLNMDVRTDQEKREDEINDSSQEEGRCYNLCTRLFCCCGKTIKDKPGQENKPEKRRGLQYLLMKGVYTDSLVLHDESERSRKHNLHPVKSSTVPDKDTRKELDEKWSTFYKFQPMWHIRNYFGEKIGLYFAWTGVLITTLWIPMLFGVAVFIYGLYESLSATTVSTNTTASAFTDVLEDVKKAFDNNVTPFFALFICCWGTIFLEVWKRTCSTLAYEWDVDQFETNEPDRPQFYGTVVKKDPITSEFAWFYPFKRQLLKFSASAAVLIFMVCVVIASVFAVIVYRVIMNIDYCPNMSQKECLILTTIVSSILNAVSILILGKVYDKLAVILSDWENHRTQTSYDDSLIIKMFAFQFVNSYASCFYIAFIRGHGSLFEDRYIDNCEGSCMAQLSFQVLTLMIVKPFPKFFKDIGIPFLKKIWKRLRSCCQNNQVQSDREQKNEQSQTDRDIYLEQERSKPDLNDFTMGEYTEKVILYGFLMLFACSFPLAPLMAIVICFVDIRVDAKRLLWLFRRPVAFIAEDIGMWYNILNFVNFVGVLTNAFIIAFTSSWGSQFDITGKLAVVIGFEHIVFILKFFLAYLIPDVPEDVKLSMRREKYLVNRKMENEHSHKSLDFTRLFPLESISEEVKHSDVDENGSEAKKKRFKGRLKPLGLNYLLDDDDFDEMEKHQDGKRMHNHLSTSDSGLVTKAKKSSFTDSVFHLKFKSPSFHRMSSVDPTTETLISEA